MLLNQKMWNKQNMSEAIQVAGNRKEIMAAALMKKQANTEAAIAGALIGGAVSSGVSANLASGKEWQDPSTVTKAQLQSPVDIRI
jgi:hypothetical protein